MNLLKKVIPAVLLLFAGTASAYDHNLFWKAEQLEKSAWHLAKNLNYQYNRYNRHVAKDARILARAARGLKWAVRNNASQSTINGRFNRLKHKYNHLMSNLGYRRHNTYYGGYRGRHLGHDVRSVRRNFHRVQRTVYNTHGYYNRYNRYNRSNHYYYSY